MTLTHRQILTIGPIVLVAACYAIAAPARHIPVKDYVKTLRDEAVDEGDASEPLLARCQTTATRLCDQFGCSRLASIEHVPVDTLQVKWNFVIHEPFVIGGDLDERDLESCYQDTILPTARALAFSYFHQPPCNPITILICSSDERFRDCNLRLDNQDRSQYSGIYSRRQRRLVVNIASGDGTLAHELTHALAHADFPKMPEWIEEGLASLHEECEFSTDGLHLIGCTNWRREVAFEALQQGELRLLEDISSNRFGSRGRATIDYAYVRSLCLYLQEQGVLESFYRTCRIQIASDPTGVKSLCQVSNVSSPKAIDDAFRSWLISQASSIETSNSRR